MPVDASRHILMGLIQSLLLPLFDVQWSIYLNYARIYLGDAEQNGWTDECCKITRFLARFLESIKNKNEKTTEPNTNNANDTKKNLKADCQMAPTLYCIGVVEQYEQNVEKLKNACDDNPDWNSNKLLKSQSCKKNGTYFKQET